MSISSISGSGAPALAPLPAGTTMAVVTSVEPGSSDSALVNNVQAAASGVSAAIQSVGSALGSIINTTA